MRELAVARLILDKPDDPYARGFVRWRFWSDLDPDASGTTEALRVAAGLWFGGRVFDRQLDTDLAVMFVERYGRHAFIDQAV